MGLTQAHPNNQTYHILVNSLLLQLDYYTIEYMCNCFVVGLYTKLCEYTPTRRGGVMHQSSLTGKSGNTCLVFAVLYLITCTYSDEAWEIPRSELICESEIAKGQCGVSVYTK